MDKIANPGLPAPQWLSLDAVTAFALASLRHTYRGITGIGLWRAMAWAVAGIAIWDGAGFFVRGNVVATPDELAVMRNVPGGMRTHGIIMLLIACAVIYASSSRSSLARRIFLVAFTYSVWVSFATISGWAVTHRIAWSAPSKWFLIAWITIWLAATSESVNERR